MARTMDIQGRIEFILFLEEKFNMEQISDSQERILARGAIVSLAEEGDYSYAWLVNGDEYRTERGHYRVPLVSEIEQLKANQPKESEPDDSDIQDEFLKEKPVNASEFKNTAQQSPVTTVPTKSVTGTRIIGYDPNISFVPNKLLSYVPWGNWRPLHKILKSERFFTVYITGLTGNGKTTMVEQLCADLDRDFIRANITHETDEMDLLGGFRLIDGETVFEYGPVVVAMLRGAVLLLDEVDLASSKIMCLQPVLEGKPVFLKKIGKWIHPKPGFTVFATANTKGRGSETGHYIGTNQMNEAFLDRFKITVSQPYAPEKEEIKILTRFYESIVGETAPEDVTKFIGILVKWSKSIRDRFESGDCADLVSTRRLLDIVDYYTIFSNNRKTPTNNMLDAIDACTERFDDETRGSFRSLFKAMVSDEEKSEVPAEKPKTDKDQFDDVPF